MPSSQQEKFPKISYRVQVSYAVEQISALRQQFDHVSELYSLCPWTRHVSCKEMSVISGEREFVLAEVPLPWFGDRIDWGLDRLAERFGALGFRFAIELEVIAFAKAKPYAQYENDILAAGSSVVGFEGGRLIACLDEYQGESNLTLVPMEDIFKPKDRLLLVRK